jgi:ABC-type uncharacterized transport system permease subunit
MLPLSIFIIAVACVVAMQWLFNRTALGPRFPCHLG